MKLQLTSLFLGLAATVVSAQEQLQTGPFSLHITGKGENSSIDGYAGSCHAGAAIEGFCYSAGELPAGSNSFQYYFNYTNGSSTIGDAPIGQVIWKLPYLNGTEQAYVEQTMGLQYSVNSNVAAPMFGFGSYSYLPLGFDADGKLFAYSYLDDSTFTPGQNPGQGAEPKAYYQWYVCWQYFTSYYYQSVGWSTTDTPHNPTCEAVDITQVFATS